MLIMSGLMMGLLLAALDQTIVTTALTTISRDFHRLDLYSWVITAYLLTSTASTPLYGKLSDQFGRKRVFQIAVVIFLIGSVLSGLSQSMIQLILFRGVQGLGAGGLMTLAMAIVGDVIPPRERGRYQGYFGAVFGISSIIGPLIGGFLVDEASWRWVFYVNIPIGVVTLVVINRVLHLEERHRKAKVDVLGSVLIVLGGVVVPDRRADRRDRGPNHRRPWVYGVAGLLLVGVFVWWETQGGRADPAAAALPDPGVQCGQRAVVHYGHGDVRGHDLPAAVFPAGPRHQPDPVGLRLVPMLAGMLLTVDRLGPADLPAGRYKVFVVAGTGILTLGPVLDDAPSRSTPAGGCWPPCCSWWGAGSGLFMQTLLLVVQNSIPYEDMGAGTAAVTFFRTLGGAVGSAVLGAVLIEQVRTTGPTTSALRPDGRALQAFTHGMTTAFLYTVPVAALAFGLSFLLRDVG